MNRLFTTLLLTLAISSSAPAVDGSPPSYIANLHYEKDDEGDVFGFMYFHSPAPLADAILTGHVDDRVKSAEEVTLFCEVVTGAEISAIGSLNSLRVLRLKGEHDYVSVDNAAIDAICRIKNLRELELNLRAMGPLSFRQLNLLSDLDTLKISGPITLVATDLDAVGDLHSLTNLQMEASFACADFLWLSRLRKLHSLGIRANGCDEKLASALGQLEQLEELIVSRRDLDAYQLDPGHLEVLGASCGSRLKRLRLELGDFSKFNDVNWAQLFPQLEELRVNSGFESIDLTEIAKLKRLKRLVLFQAYVNDQGLSQLGRHPRLEEVVFGNADLSVASVSICKEMPSLKQVSFGMRPNSLQVEEIVTSQMASDTRK